jgi:hypothetical protein
VLGENVHTAFLQIKGNTCLYPITFIEEQMANTHGGTSIVLKGPHPNGAPLIVIGYRYSTRMILYLVMMDDAGTCIIGDCCSIFQFYIFVICPTRFILVYPTAGTTIHGKPYEIKWVDFDKNLHIHHGLRPQLPPPPDDVLCNAETRLYIYIYLGAHILKYYYKF